MMRVLAPLALLALLIACASAPKGPTIEDAQRDLAEGRTAEAIATLEELRAANPDDSEIALELGTAYFREARRALDEGDDETWLHYLGLAQDQVLSAAELDPQASGPHTWMGIIAAYQSDLERTLTSLQNARRLDPRQPVHYTNLAETYIYMGKISRARRMLKKARKLGAPPIFIEMNEVLAAWRTGDYTEARDVFETAYALNPSVVKIWNEAPVADPIESFEDFTRFCCSHLACGPYMAKACRKMDHDPRQRDVAAETARQELLLEMERRRRLQEIYEDRRDLEITVEPVEVDSSE